MKRKYIYIGICVLVIVLGIIVYAQIRTKDSRENSAFSPIESLAPIPPNSLEETYTNEKYAFSFRHPKEYEISVFPDEENPDADIVLFQNNSTSVGFQIRIQPIDEDISVLTVDRIKQDLPDITINSPQDVILGSGDSAGKGVAFLSNDPAFGGTSREVWFVFNKNLYQIRTYSSYDPLIQAVLGTWKFHGV